MLSCQEKEWVCRVVEVMVVVVCQAVHRAGVVVKGLGREVKLLMEWLKPLGEVKK